MEREVGLTLQEAADELGVHYMTAYRYVRLGLIDAVKSAGTWCIAPAAIDAFRTRASNAPVAAGDRAPWASRLESRLVAGDSTSTWGVIESAMTSGTDVDEIYLDVLTPAMVSIGERWSKGELDVAIEHRASGMATRIVGRIGPRFARRGRARGTIVTAAPIGELHTLPMTMMSDLLRLAGWDVSDLGTNLPSASLVVLLRDTPECVAVGLSVTAAQNLAALVESCSAVRIARPELLIVVGGHAVRGDGHALALGADRYARTAAEMSELVQARLDDRVATSGR